MTSAPLGFRVVAGLVRACVALGRWKLDVEGMQHVPRAGGAVLTWNHTSHVDFAATALPLYRTTGRWVRLVALDELWDSPLLGWLPRLGHCVPVDRGTEGGRRSAFRHAVEALQAGDVVMVAPEGRISESLELLPFRTGPARMAQAAGVPLVPSASWGTHMFSTTGRRASLRRGWRLPVVVRFGAPLAVDHDDDPAAATEELQRRTRMLVDRARTAHQGIAARPGGNH